VQSPALQQGIQAFLARKASWTKVEKAVDLVMQLAIQQAKKQASFSLQCCSELQPWNCFVKVAAGGASFCHYCHTTHDTTSCAANLGVCSSAVKNH
jgi:hypothetical protein